MKKLLLLLISAFVGFGANAQVCGDFTLDMQDSWGDGWTGGASLVITANGTPVTGSPFICGSGAETATFSTNEGDAIEVTFTAGDFDSEINYQLYDESSTEVLSGDVTAGVVYTGIACPPPPVCGDFTLDMQDSWGDGWTGGASLVITANGTPVTGSPFICGSGAETATFSTNEGDTIEVTFTAGDFDSEINYQLYDESSTEVLSGDVTAGVVYTGIACPPPPPPVVCGDFTLEMQDSWGDGWTGGASLVITANGAPVTGSPFICGGSTASATFSTNELDTIEVTFTAGDYDSEITYQLTDESAALLVEDDVNAGVVYTGIACPPPPPPVVCGDFTLEMQDSWGDGWTGGASLVITANGTPVTGSPFICGGATASATFSTNELDTIEVTFTAGDYDSEITYQLTDESATLLVEDDVNAGVVYTGIACAPGCSGTPAVTNTASTDTLICSGVGFTVSLETPLTEPGYTYQWQSSSDGITYNDLVSGTSETFDTSIVADTWFQCVVTCTNSGLSNSTTPLNVILNTNVQECYCEPVYGTTTNSGCLDGDVIARVILNTLDNNSGTGCPSGTAGYSDYTDSLSLTTTLNAGTTYGCTVYAGEWNEGYKAWIDYNQDGVFDNSPVGTPGSEVIGNTTSSVPGSGSAGVLGGNVTFPITLACNPTPGTYRLRIRCIYNNSGPSIDPCIFQSNWGETEDYLISIAPPPPCPDILGLAASNVTTNSADIDWVLGCAEIFWNYEVSTSPNPPVAGSNVNATSQTASGLTSGTTYYAHVRALCGNSNVSSWSTVSFTTAAVAPANDDCVDAIELICGQTETVTTTAATSDASTGTCGVGTGGTPGIGVWYRFVGTGDEVQVSLCNSDYDTKLHIYKTLDSTCNTLICVESNDDGALCSALQSSVTFDSELGTVYYILPSGFSTATGNLEISISCIPQGVTTWLGTSTDDDDPANWSSGSVPDCSTDIFIPLTANNPTFDSLFECNNFGIASTVNALVLAASDTLGICGDVLISGNAGITGPGWVSLNGTNGGTSIKGTSGSTINNLMLTSDYSVLDDLDISSALLLNGGNIDATSGTITLKSDINGTAYFDDFSEIGGTFTGDLTQERYVASSTVPGGISTGQRLFGTAVSNGSVSGLNQQYSNYPNGLGAIVPTAACDPTILDANSPYSNLFEWNESAPTSCYLEGWTAISDASALISSRGYSGWMDLGSVISVTGIPNTGVHSFAGVTTGNVANASGWHVLSNPFPSPINVSAITTGGFTSAQFYDNTTAFAGTYQPMLVGMTEIPIMQGFIAQATAPSTFDVSNSDRIATNNPEFYKSNNWFDYKLEVIVNVDQSQDITYLYYSDIATANFDNNGDCVKRESDVNKPTLYTRNNAQMLSLNGLHLNDLGMSVPMGLIAQSQSAASLSFTGMTDFPVNTTIYLEDKVNGVFHNIINGDYTFTADPSENGTDRFEIHFVLPVSFNLVEPTCENTNGAIIDNTIDGREYNIFNEGLVIGLGVLDGSSNELAAGDYTIEVYDQYGGSQTYDITVEEITPVTAGIISSASAIESGESIDFEFNGSNAFTYEWAINGQVVAQTELFSFEFTTPGQYVVEVFAANDICEAVATRIIEVAEKTTAVIEIGKGSLSIYESDGDVVLNFTNINQGKVRASIYNLLGQELASVGLESSGKQTIQNVNWADGYYLVKVQIGQQVVNETVLITKK